MQESASRSLFILLSVALVCSVLVSVSAVLLRPIQEQNELIERYRNIALLSGLLDEQTSVDDEAVLVAVASLDVRVVNLNTGRFTAEISAENIDVRGTVTDPELSVDIPASADLARLGRRPIYQVVYLVWADNGLSRVIVPIHGQGMWSTLYGLLALEADLNTIAAVTFYEQEETAGLGDQIENPHWLARWAGRRLFGPGGDVRFRIAQGVIEDDTPAAAHQVDGLSGATVTSSAVTALVSFWFGPDGYGPLLDELTRNPPTRALEKTED